MKRIFDISGLVGLFGLAVITAHTFYVAYLNGGQVLVNINSIGEANFEAVLVGVVVIWGLVSLIRIIWRLAK